MAVADLYYTLIAGNLSAIIQLSLLVLAIPIVFLYPLYKIAQTRLALMLIFSKAIASIFCNTLTLYLWILTNMIGVKPTTLWCIKYAQLLSGTPCIAVRVHLLVMAYNRAYSICFPFSYARNARKKNLLLCCATTWAISFVLSAGINCVSEYKIALPFPLSLVNLGSIYDFCAITALALYLLVAAKLLWMKYNCKLDGIKLEKDHWRISLACLTSVLPFILNRIGISVARWPGYLDSPILIKINMTIIGPGNTISQMSEELCLLIVCPDFRNAVWGWLCQIGDWTLFVLTLGAHKKRKVIGGSSGQNGGDHHNNNNNNCCLFIRRTNGTVGTMGMPDLINYGNGH